MASILKESKKNSKGVIVFTHKEKYFFENHYLLKIFDKELNALKEKYFFAMHWGHFHDNVKIINKIDFHLAGIGTLIFDKPEENYHIPLCSRNFISEEFRKKSYTKIYDIVNVSRPLRLKKLDEFFLVVRKMMDKGFYPKVLLICPLSENFAKVHGNYTEIYDDYLKLFNEVERKNITLLLLSEHGNPFQLSERTISDFMNMSKVFTLFSDKEGESRVVAEALLCGLPVVVKKNIIGGAKDYLDSKNSKLFQSLDDAADVFIELITNYKQYAFDTKYLEKELSEKYTKNKLKNELELFFKKQKEPFSGQFHLDNLARKLPSHENNFDKNIAHGMHDDIIKYTGFYRFIVKYNHKKISNIKLFRVYCAFVLANIKRTNIALIVQVLKLMNLYSIVKRYKDKK